MKTLTQHEKFNESAGQNIYQHASNETNQCIEGHSKIIKLDNAHFYENDSANEETKKWVTRNFENSSISGCLLILNDRSKFNTIISSNCTNVFNDDNIGEFECLI